MDSATRYDPARLSGRVHCGASGPAAHLVPASKHLSILSCEFASIPPLFSSTLTPPLPTLPPPTPQYIPTELLGPPWASHISGSLNKTDEEH
ncbi:hypothetical protein E2C01_101495 [Portunus trituberculatus]|uniref:Uncharacterized protein n=1 Tax=Portunus trituberculatus TaxID=210409 RepID=A0A5B7KM43_PORTR|nr:hypothetical protein [Portunus trituberculatus]